MDGPHRIGDGTALVPVFGPVDGPKSREERCSVRSECPCVRADKGPETLFYTGLEFSRGTPPEDLFTLKTSEVCLNKILMSDVRPKTDRESSLIGLVGPCNNRVSVFLLENTVPFFEGSLLEVQTCRPVCVRSQD